MLRPRTPRPSAHRENEAVAIQNAGDSLRGTPAVPLIEGDSLAAPRKPVRIASHARGKAGGSDSDALVDAARAAAVEIAAMAADRDVDGCFPADEMAILRRAGLLAAPLPDALGGSDLGGRGSRHALYRVLALVGGGSLPVGRLFEGHVNALELVRAFGTSEQLARAADDVHDGHVFGVWNTQAAGGVELHETAGGGVRMAGAKTFCSGASEVMAAGYATTRPVVTGALIRPDGTDAGWQMAVVSLDGHAARVAPDSWLAAGMHASVSGRTDFTDLHLPADALVGAPGDYFREPGFNGGAVRFAAVHAGGARALLDAAVAFLRETGRTGDPHQRARIGRAAIACESADLWLLGAARLRESGADAESESAYAGMVRTAVERVCLDVMEAVDRAVGARGLMQPSAIERIGRDLRLYLRQPAPDAVLDAVGAAVLDAPHLVRGSDA